MRGRSASAMPARRAEPELYSVLGVLARSPSRPAASDRSAAAPAPCRDCKLLLRVARTLPSSHRSNTSGSVLLFCRKTPRVNVCERSPKSLETDADDVIDLGAPRVPRRLQFCAAPAPQPPRRAYVPNPRLYPGRGRPRRAADGRSGSPRPRRRKRVLRRPVPNSRLYRSAPARPPPPPARPRASWPPPAPVRLLDTASRVALRVGERRLAGRARCEPAPATPPLVRSRHLVVTLPAAAGGDSPASLARYRPASEHTRARAPTGASTPPAGRAMDSSPDRTSDGNDSPSAPSEYLAEFLSAIMRRQYAEALKYCRLILQYEPQNATARSFHPLLQQKLRDHRRAAAAGGAGSDSQATSCSSADSDLSEEEDASAASRSSLDLDSESASASGELSRRTDTASWSGLSAAAAAARWESSDADDNGNLLPAPAPAPALSATDGDLENDNAGGDAAVGVGVGATHTSTHLKMEGGPSAASASLQRLRAQFACSIK